MRLVRVNKPRMGEWFKAAPPNGWICSVIREYISPGGYAMFELGGATTGRPLLFANKIFQDWCEDVSPLEYWWNRMSDRRRN